MSIIRLIVGFVFILCFNVSMVFAQNYYVNDAETYNNWSTVKIAKLGELQIPPTMEYQDLEYVKNVMSFISESDKDHRYYKNLTDQSLEGNRFVFQQKGLNDATIEVKKYREKRSAATREAFEKYGRFIVGIGRTEYKFPKIGGRLDFSSDELIELRQELLQGISGTPIRIYNMSDAIVSSVNEIECVYIKYDSIFENNPVVKNEIYMFFDGYIWYRFNVMYRSTQEDFWTNEQNDIRKIINTVRFKR